MSDSDDDDIKSDCSDNDDGEHLKPHTLTKHDEIFFKSKYARQRLKTSNRKEHFQASLIDWTSSLSHEASKEEQSRQIQSLQEENDALKKNNSNYLIEISRLKLSVNYYKVQNIETKVLLRKTADYMDRLCRYLEDIDAKLKTMELDNEKGFTSGSRFTECRRLIESTKEANFDYSLSSPYALRSHDNVEHNFPKIDLLKNLRQELFSFCVAGKAISTTFKRNAWYDRSLAVSPSLSSSSKVESGFSSLESKASLREECISGYFNV